MIGSRDSQGRPYSAETAPESLVALPPFRPPASGSGSPNSCLAGLADDGRAVIGNSPSHPYPLPSEDTLAPRTTGGYLAPARVHCGSGHEKRRERGGRGNRRGLDTGHQPVAVTVLRCRPYLARPPLGYRSSSCAGEISSIRRKQFRMALAISVRNIPATVSVASVLAFTISANLFTLYSIRSSQVSSPKKSFPPPGMW